ncbi:MAG TPA: hypothetical protein VF741_04745 [Candidatus Aquilonibacter sp.]
MVSLVLALVVAAASAAPAGNDLSYFAGSWNCTGTFANGRPISSTLTFDSSLTGKGVILRQDDVPPNAYHAAALWGPAADGSLVSEIQDVTGGMRRFTSSGWSAGSLTWASAPEITPANRFVYTWLDASTMRVDWEVQVSGTYKVGDTLHCTRR